ncbi:hypothetical protein KDK77_08590 [bacterium]|nr:hypothetical protein [bacterium]
MKKGFFALFLIAVLSFGVSANASTVLEFGSVAGESLGRITNLGGDITLKLGQLELKNLDSGDDLYRATVDFSDIIIDPLSKQTIIGNTVTYDVYEDITVSGFALFAQVDNIGGLERIMYGDLEVDILLTTDAAGAIDADISVDVTNFTLDNVAKMNLHWGSVPSILNDFVAIGLADLIISITADGGLSIADAIDNGDFLPNLTVTGTLQVVPEPGVMGLSLLGFIYLAKRIKRKIS